MKKTLLAPAVIVGALGYFVDIFDLVMFSIVRVASLGDLGVPAAEQLSVGVWLINCQMSGLFLGGILWGILGDKRGRVSVLFGSICLYSLANIANAFVHSVELYAVLRFIAGIGLAGELGAAITLVSEVLPKEKRGYGTAIVAGVGLSGAVFAGLLADFVSWRVAYFVGGSLGLCLLVLRMKMAESGIYESLSDHSVRRGDLRLLFSSPKRILKYLRCILIGVPIWYVVGVLVTFAPEIGKALGATEPLSAGSGILFCYAGVAAGDLFSGFLSQWISSRKRVVGIFMATLTLLVVALLFSRGFSAAYFYTFCVLLGLATGYWAVFVTISAEQFGTNLRATVATTTPNIVRGSVVILTSSFHALKPLLGIPHAALAVGLTALVFGAWALYGLEETFGRDLNFLETENR